MRVLFLTHRLPFAPNRGDRIRAYHIARHLARHHEIDLLSLMHDQEEESRTADLRFIFSRVEVARVPRASNLARAVAALPTSRPLTHVLLDAPGLRRRLAALVAERPTMRRMAASTSRSTKLTAVPRARAACR